VFSIPIESQLHKIAFAVTTQQVYVMLGNKLLPSRTKVLIEWEDDVSGGSRELALDVF